MADGGVTWQRAATETAAARRADERPASMTGAGRDRAGRRLSPSRVPPHAVPAIGSASRPGGPDGAVRLQQGLRPSAVAVPDGTLGLDRLRKSFPRVFGKRPPAVAAAPAGPVHIVTETLVPAPDQTASSRATVGVGDRVMITPWVAVEWIAYNDDFASDLGNARSVIWTAPSSPGTYSVRAVPQDPTEATPGQVTMSVTGPQRINLTKRQDLAYAPHYAGSGFVAAVSVEPMNVSFGETQIREEAAVASADGYYRFLDKVQHPTGQWNQVDAANGGFGDAVGTKPPGYAPPFGAGYFNWDIALSYRLRHSNGPGTPFDASRQTLVMTGPDGTTTTAKKGATRTRTPTPLPQQAQAEPDLVPRDPQAEGPDDQPALPIGRITGR